MSLDERITETETARHVQRILESQRLRNQGAKTDYFTAFGKTLVPPGIVGFVLGSAMTFYHSLNASKEYVFTLAFATLSATMALIGNYLKK